MCEGVSAWSHVNLRLRPQVLIQENPRFMYPAYEMQNRMRQATLGEQWFKQWMRKKGAKTERKEKVRLFCVVVLLSRRTDGEKGIGQQPP